MTIKVAKAYSEAKYSKIEKRWVGYGKSHAREASKRYNKITRAATKLYLKNIN